MTDITRVDIEEAMKAAVVDADTPESRNEQRKQAVVEYLADKPDGRGTQGTIHEMILSDLKSYPEWENV